MRGGAAFKDNRKKKPCCPAFFRRRYITFVRFYRRRLALTFSPLAARFALVCVCAPPRLHTRSSSLDDEREDDVMLYEKARGSFGVKFSFLPRASCCQRDF